jgi:hypothetical protein
VNTRQAIWLAATVLTLAASCKTFKRDDSGGATYDAGTFEAAPSREVVDDGGLVGGGGTGGTIADGATTPYDMTVLPADRLGPDFATLPDLGVDRDPTDNSCDLLLQDCPANKGCYPGPAGRGICQVPQTETSPCTDDTTCPAGRVCIDLTCTPLCSTTAMTCPSAERCMAYPAIPGIGYCVPGSGARIDSGL